MAFLCFDHARKREGCLDGFFEIFNFGQRTGILSTNGAMNVGVKNASLVCVEKVWATWLAVFKCFLKPKIKVNLLLVRKIFQRLV